jgi:hypothetical protein
VHSFNQSLINCYGVSHLKEGGEVRSFSIKVKAPGASEDNPPELEILPAKEVTGGLFEANGTDFVKPSTSRKAIEMLDDSTWIFNLELDTKDPLINLPKQKDQSGKELTNSATARFRFKIRARSNDRSSDTVLKRFEIKLLQAEPAPPTPAPVVNPSLTEPPVNPPAGLPTTVPPVVQADPNKPSGSADSSSSPPEPETPPQPASPERLIAPTGAEPSGTQTSAGLPSSSNRQNSSNKQTVSLVPTWIASSPKSKINPIKLVGTSSQKLDVSKATPAAATRNSIRNISQNNKSGAKSTSKTVLRSSLQINKTPTNKGVPQ